MSNDYENRTASDLFDSSWKLQQELEKSSDESSEDGAEDRLIKEKGLSPGPKKWYAHTRDVTRDRTHGGQASLSHAHDTLETRNTTRTPYELTGLGTMEGSTTPYEFPVVPSTMEGSSSVKNKVESDFKRRSRLHERDSGKTITSGQLVCGGPGGAIYTACVGRIHRVS